MSQIEIYTGANGEIGLEVTFEQDAVWLTQKQMVSLFQSSKANISEHAKHTFNDGELDRAAVVWNFRTTAAEAKRQIVVLTERNNFSI